MYAPAPHDEITGLTGYLDQQLSAIRAASYGLTEEEARRTPCRSALSVGGILKHAAYGLRGAATVIREGGRSEIPPEAFAAHAASFALTDAETMAEMLTEFDEARAAAIAVIADADPDADFANPPQPWFGVFAPQPTKLRYYLVHQIEEMARHAGHADIIREELDGQSIATLELSLAGTPANDFFTPYVAAPGTIGA